MARTKRTRTKHEGVFRDGERWWIQVTRRDSKGKRKYRGRYLDGALSVADVLTQRALLIKEVETGLQSSPQLTKAKAAKTTLAAYAELWLQQKAPRLRASVLEHYLDVLGRRVLPVLGERDVEQLSRRDVEAWINWAEAQECRLGRPYSEATLNSWWRVLTPLLRDLAAERGLVDPTLRLRSPRSTIRRVREGATLTHAQLGQLLESVKTYHPGWYAETFVLAFTGMRGGELYALKWDDIDENAGVIHITRAVWRGNETLTKTEDPRDVALTAPLREVLSTHHREQLRQRPSLQLDLVFPSSSGIHRGTSALLKMLRLAAMAGQIPTRVTPQVLRRTFNTLMLEAGANEVVLRSQMGHTSQRMTSRYAGIHPEAKRSAVERLHELTR